MNRRGFALITVLWVVAALATLVTLGVASADVDRRAAENRVLLRRAMWAARACVAIARGRYDPRSRTIAVDSTDLGRGAWCRADDMDPSVRLNVNTADSIALARVLGDDLLTAALLDWRDPGDEPRPTGAEADWYLAEGRLPPRNGPFASIEEVELVHGLEEAPPDALERLLTVRGDGRLDPNRASPAVLGALSLLPDGTAARLVRLREGGARFDDAEEVVVASGATLGPSAFRELTRRLVFEPRERVVRVVGGASNGARTLRSTLVVTLTVTTTGLAVNGVELDP